MSQALSERLADVESGYAIEANGLKVLRPLSDAEWESVGRELGTRLRGIQWAIGDWLIYGGIVGGYGDKWTRAMELTGESHAFIWRCYSVAKAYPQGKRIAYLSFSHHEDALCVEDGSRMALLKRCAAERWTKVQWQAALRREPRQNPVRSDAAKFENAIRRVAKTTTALESSDRVAVGVECPHCHRFIEEAALAALPRKERDEPDAEQAAYN